MLRIRFCLTRPPLSLSVIRPHASLNIEMRHRLTFVLAGLGVAVPASAVLYVLVIVADATPAGAYRNVSPSMEPVVRWGDRFTVRKYSSDAKPVVRRGTPVAHVWPPDPSKEFIKRVVGLPGDTLAMVNGTLQVNGQPLPEPYAWLEDSTIDPVSDDFRWQRAYLVGPAMRDTTAYKASRNNWGPLAVPAGMYFVLGDNRDNSLDSRYWGFLPDSDLIGEVRRVYFSRDSTGHIRWSRLGHRIQ
jgi:signal peptidase I